MKRFGGLRRFTHTSRKPKSPHFIQRTRFGSPVKSVSEDRHRGIHWCGVSFGVRQLPHTLLLLFAILTGSAQAQDSPYFRHVTTADGLNGSSVISLAVDQKGFVWIGTANGLTRHDGARTKAFHHVPGDSSSLPNARVDFITVTRDGSVYIGTQDGAVRFDEAKQSFWRLPIDAEERVVVHDIDELPSGKLLLSTWQHGAFEFNPRTDTATPAPFRFAERPEERTVRNIALADSGYIWLARYRGLYRVDLESGRIEMPDWPASTLEWLEQAAIFKLMVQEDILWMPTTEGLWSLETRSGELVNHSFPDVDDPYARSTFVDSKGTLWAGMHGKLARYDRATKQFRIIEPVRGLESSVFPGTVHAFAEDHSGVLWIGSDERGLSLLDLYSVPPSHVEARLNPQTGLPEGHIWSAAEASDGSFLLGSERTFGRWLPVEQRFEPIRATGLENTTVSAILVDRQNRTWVGTTGRGLCQLNPAGTRCLPVASDITTVYDIYQDTDDALWIGTFAGLLHLNLQTGVRKWYRHDTARANTLDSGLVLDIHRDASGRLWVGTDSGLNRHDPISDGFVRVLTNNPVFSIEPRPDGQFWLAGLDVSIFNPETAEQKFLSPFQVDLSDGMSKTVLMDREGRLWVSFATSTVVLDMEGREAGRFENPHGRRSFEFPVSASMLTRDGSLLFGLQDAFISFQPEELVLNPFPPIPAVSEVRVDDQQVAYGSDLPLLVGPDHRILSVAFSSPHFSNPEETLYEVRLSGLDDEWRTVDSPQISFTTLPPADYLFDVRATASNGLSATLASPMQLTVLAPWWTRWWFNLLMLGSGAGLVLLIVTWRTGDLRRQNARLDEEVARRTLELSEKALELEVANQTKSRFFSNVSHELRTPLTLIKGYLEGVQVARDNQDPLDPVSRGRITRARGLTDRLDEMVGQLLDLSRADNSRLELKAVPSDLCSFVARVVAHFQIAAHRKFIDLGFESDSDQMPVMLDPIKMDQVVSNLLSNAIKFTPNNGSIWVSLNTEDDEALLSVSDTGPGIPKKEQERIFERFYQVENELTREHEGLGIGLALSSDLVKLHGGTINVVSEPGEGSVFSIRLKRISNPSGVLHFSDVPLTPGNSDVSLESPLKDAESRPTLLLVEDNRELRRHIREILVDLFEIEEASDGAEGWKKIQLRNPDLVLSDVMMPGMSGLELLKEVRESERFKDLPFVLLTARSGEDSKAEGLEARADDFIGKPFNRRVLRARLTNLARRQREWNEAVETAPAGGLQVDQAEFLNRIRSYLREHLSESISVAQLADVTHTSERTFQRRIKEITDMTAGAFLRKERLQVARALLERGDVRSVSHAALETGFGNVSHFSKVFEEEFGINPKTYLI